MNSNNTLNGGNVMNRLSILIAAMLAIAIGACAPQDTVSIDGPVPVTTEDGDPMGQHVMNWEADQCDPKLEGTDADECAFDEMCVLNPTASAKLDTEVFECVTLCHADFAPVDFEDGTSKVVKVEGTDTCQRLGDEDWYCDMDAANPTCVEYTTDPGPCETCNTDPVVDPEPTPDPEPQFYSITCCWNSEVLEDNVDYRVNFSGGVLDSSKSGGLNWNIVMDDENCGTSSGFYRTDNVSRGFWTKLTNGMVSDNHDNWLDGIAPEYCEVNGAEYGIGDDVQGCGFGTYDAYDAETGLTIDCH